MEGSMLRYASLILWPSFLAAIVAEGCFFSLFDPVELTACLGWHAWPPLAGYTVGFFFFWAVGALAGMLTSLLAGQAQGSSRMH
jgi:hypothetical protein